MTELERALVALGNELDFPATPDLAGAVRARLGRRWTWRRPLLLGVALAAVAIGIAMAVPPARSAILRFFHVGAATVERVETLPPAKNRPLIAGLGPERAQPTLRVPAGATAVAYYQQPGIRAALLRVDGKRVLLSEMQGDQIGLSKKLVDARTEVEEVPLGEFGIWIHGAPHVLMWQSRPYGPVHNSETRLAGDVLLWLSNGVTYRLEGPLGRERMVALARQITP